MISLMKEKNMERQTYMSTLIWKLCQHNLTNTFLKYRQFGTWNYKIRILISNIPDYLDKV